VDDGDRRSGGGGDDHDTLRHAAVRRERDAPCCRPGRERPRRRNGWGRTGPGQTSRKGKRTMTTSMIATLGSAVALALLAAAPPQGPGPARVVLPTDRTALPIPEPVTAPITEVDARKATPPPRFEVKAPAGAPNVLIVLIDDMGFGQSSAFGGPVQMPTVERL